MRTTATRAETAGTSSSTATPTTSTRSGTRFAEPISRNEQDLATGLERQITKQDRTAWIKGNIEDWVLEDHRLAQTAGALGQRESCSHRRR